MGRFRAIANCLCEMEAHWGSWLNNSKYGVLLSKILQAMGLKEADVLTVHSPQLRGSKCINTLSPSLQQPGSKWASHFDGPFELPSQGIVLKQRFMSGLAQVNRCYLELPVFVYCLAAGFKRLSEKNKNREGNRVVVCSGEVGGRWRRCSLCSALEIWINCFSWLQWKITLREGWENVFWLIPTQPNIVDCKMGKEFELFLFVIHLGVP